jgi:hypothetical protein
LFRKDEFRYDPAGETLSPNHEGEQKSIILKTAVGVGWSADWLAFSTSGCGSAGREA